MIRKKINHEAAFMTGVDYPLDGSFLNVHG
jgi:hypothetical protein